MAGQIVKRGAEKWLVRVYSGEVAGKRKYVSQTIRGGKKDAQIALRKLLAQKDARMLVDSSRQSVGAFLKEWLELDINTRVGKRTARDYRQYTERYLIPALGGYKLAQLTRAHVERMYADMSSGAIGTRRLSPRTVRFAHAVLRLALERAVSENKIARNPAIGATLPARNSREMRALTPDEARRFLAAAANDSWGAFFTLLLVVGVRPSEAAALKWSDLDGSQLSVQRALTPGYHSTWSEHKTKSKRSKRTVILPAMVQTALQSHKRRQAAERLAAGSAYEKHNFIFANADGSPVHPSGLGKRPFVRILKVAGLPPMRLYDLRHTSASLALSSGEPVKVVSERLGHSSVTLTLDTYSHVTPGMQIEAAERMQRPLAGNA
jgi:integrase